MVYEVAISLSWQVCESNNILENEPVGFRLYRRTRKITSINILEGSIDWMRKSSSSDLQKRIIDFINDSSQSPAIIRESKLDSSDHFQDLIALRESLTQDFLIHCLKLRHGVNYGVVPIIRR
jgi:hypothetical protein